MKFRLRFKKRNSVLISVFASATFVWLAITRLGLPKEKVVVWLITLVVLLVILIALAAVVALLLRWLLNRNANQTTIGDDKNGNGNENGNRKESE